MSHVNGRTHFHEKVNIDLFQWVESTITHLISITSLGPTPFGVFCILGSSLFPYLLEHRRGAEGTSYSLLHITGGTAIAYYEESVACAIEAYSQVVPRLHSHGDNYAACLDSMLRIIRFSIGHFAHSNICTMSIQMILKVRESLPGISEHIVVMERWSTGREPVQNL